MLGPRLTESIGRMSTPICGVLFLTAYKVQSFRYLRHGATPATSPKAWLEYGVEIVINYQLDLPYTVI